ncbi:MAG TPA: fibronectin type III domain-containing protein [Candidatus Absconditabacterales bacterium]|nr:fibronectin type III domain-containing protein [Candidatus Absconditabacterales bacterium]
MRKLYPRFLLILLVFFAIFFGFTFAEDPDAFLVQVEPSSFGVSESVDVTISAVKNGMIVKDYIGDVFIEVEGLMPDDYVVPSDGLYSFLIQDQGIKLFSKGLEIKKSGTYNLKISDIIDETIMGETTVIVGNAGGNSNFKDVDITSPIAGSTERRSATNIIGSSPDLPNSPVEIYLNNEPASNGYTDSQGNFSIYIQGLQEGQNQIQAKITDISDVVLGESDVIILNYESLSDGVFNSIEILPSSNIKQGDKVSFNIYTSEGVTSAELELSNNKTFPLDRLSPGVFNKDVVLSSQGNIDVSISLVANGNSKYYEDVANIFVQQNDSISNVRFHSVGVDGTSVNVSWDPIGDAPKYRISYGTDRNSLQKTVDVNSTQVLVENIQSNTVYYFQILPLDDGLHASGEPSEIVEYNPKEVYSSCVVKGIIVTSEKIGDKYYLTRDDVENVTKYEIYKSDREDMSDMKKVGETTETRFEYNFNKYAESDQYAYYQVEAICSDGSTVTIDEAKEVKVGPIENTLLVIIIALFFYSIYRLYKTTD